MNLDLRIWSEKVEKDGVMKHSFYVTDNVSNETKKLEAEYTCELREELSELREELKEIDFDKELMNVLGHELMAEIMIWKGYGLKQD